MYFVFVFVFVCILLLLSFPSLCLLQAHKTTHNFAKYMNTYQAFRPPCFCTENSPWPFCCSSPFFFQCSSLTSSHIKSLGLKKVNLSFMTLLKLGISLPKALTTFMARCATKYSSLPVSRHVWHGMDVP